MRRWLPALAALASACASLPTPESAWLERPYVWASSGRVELRACRWSLDEPIGVALAADATPAEAHALDAALASLAASLPGLRWLRVGRGAGVVEVRFVDAALPRADGSLGSGRTVADCRLFPESGRAALVAARVEVARHAPPDWRGRERALDAEERSGVLVHELGHALGVPGHAARTSDALAAAPEAARRAGRQALARAPAESAALRSLYARDPGESLRSAQVEPWRTAELDRLARLAQAEGLDGPYLRAGDAVGRIFWRDDRGREWGFLVAGLATLARDPTQLWLLPEANARGALPRGGR